MLEALKVIILGIVEGITEWLPISSTGHLILVEEFIKLEQSEAFIERINVVNQLGAILAVVVIYFHKLNPFSPKKTQKQKMLTIQLWVKVAIAAVPAAVIGLLFDDMIEAKFMNAYVVAATLIIYGILFIVVEESHKNKQPAVTKLSKLTIPMVLVIGGFQVLALRGDDHRRIADRDCQRRCGRVHLFPGNPGYVRSQLFENLKIFQRRRRHYGQRSLTAPAGLRHIIRSVGIRHQVFDAVYQEP